MDESLFKAILRKLDFERVQFDKDMSRAFRAARRKRCSLPEASARRRILYIWDEPLNYIDVYSRMQLEEPDPRV